MKYKGTLTTYVLLRISEYENFKTWRLIMKANQLGKLMVMTFVIIISISMSTVFAGPDDTVKVGLITDPESLNPIEWRSQSQMAITMSTHDSIVWGVNKNAKMRNLGLAKEIKVLPTKKDVMVTLRKGPKFHTGDPVTAHDVQFTVQEIQNPVNANALIGFYDEVESVEVVDDQTAIFHFYEPYASWQEVMWIGICSKKQFEKIGRDEFRKAPAGSGPYRVVDRTIGESITLEAVPNHIDTKPDFKTVKAIVVQDPITRASMLETGELDLIFDVQPHQVVKLQSRDHIKVKKVVTPSMFYLSVKPCIYPVLNDLKVRQAINMGINRQEIVDKVYLGEGYPVYGWVNPGELGYDGTYKVEYNPKEAKALLNESKYNGETFIIAYSSVMPSASQVAEVVGHYLNEIGIQTKLWQLEYGTYLTYCRNKDKRAGHMGLSQFAIDYDPSIRFMMSMMSTSQYGYYKDGPKQQEMDNLILAQASETNPQKRVELLKKIHLINNSDPAQIALLGLKQIYAMNKRIDYEWESWRHFFRGMELIKRAE